MTWQVRCALRLTSKIFGVHLMPHMTVSVSVQAPPVHRVREPSSNLDPDWSRNWRCQASPGYQRVRMGIGTAVVLNTTHTIAHLVGSSIVRRDVPMEYFVLSVIIRTPKGQNHPRKELHTERETCYHQLRRHARSLPYIGQ